MARAATTGEIRATPFAEALGERYLSYALSTIMSRSLPDVRDGLKPVQRRILYAMRALHLDPDSGFKKCARIVGDVMGKFHPHGDEAIYNALVRLAQDFAVRYPLVDGQGNFGNVDGDNAAAMRYTEARMTLVAEALLDGIDEDAVTFLASYDGDDEEPTVLPASFPNLLANGATGIAVGMATSIPPHNAGEVCDALLHLIKYPNATIAKLVDLMPGPDFPTGGVLVENRDTLVEAYATGRGGFRVRARWETEKLKSGSYQIVVTEIPYQVQKARLIERIAELLTSRKLAMLGDVRDESTEQVRLVLEPKSRAVDATVLMESLYRQTELEARVSLNMNVLDSEQVPRVMNLRELLQSFLDHRNDVFCKRSRRRLADIERRLEILDGYLIAYLNLDEVIRIVREEDEPRQALMDAFALSELQADAILNMRLRSLRKLAEKQIQGEHVELSKRRLELLDLLEDEKKRWRAIAGEITEIRKRFGQESDLGGRRTLVSTAPSAVVVPLEAMIEREAVTVLCSTQGWIRRVKGHLDDVGDIKYKEGDGHRFVLHAETTDKIQIFATNGRFYTIGVDKLPGGRGFGEPLRLMLDVENDHNIVSLHVHRPGVRLLVVSSDGRGLVVCGDDVISHTRLGRQVLNVSGSVEAMDCVAADGDAVATIGDNRKLLIFSLTEIPEMVRGRGVILQRYSRGGMSDAKIFTKSEGLSWESGDRTRTHIDLEAWVGKRGQAGRAPPPGFPRSNKFSRI